MYLSAAASQYIFYRKFIQQNSKNVPKAFDSKVVLHHIYINFRAFLTSLNIKFSMFD